MFLKIDRDRDKRIKMMNNAWIGLGSNLGNRLMNLTCAIYHAKKSEHIEVIAISSIYETEPVGYQNQGKFLNMVIRIKTDLNAEELLDFLMKTENIMGRVRNVRWGPRIIDLDLLLFNNLCMETEYLTLPHPRMFDRVFVLIPLLETLSIRDYLLREKVELNLQKIKGDITKIFDYKDSHS